MAKRAMSLNVVTEHNTYCLLIITHWTGRIITYGHCRRYGYVNLVGHADSYVC